MLLRALATCLLLAAALLLVGCGDHDDAPKTAHRTLTLRQTEVLPKGTVFVEGSRAYATIPSVPGWEHRTYGDGERVPIPDTSMRVTIHHQVCNGMCVTWDDLRNVDGKVVGVTECTARIPAGSRDVTLTPVVHAKDGIQVTCRAGR